MCVCALTPTCSLAPGQPVQMESTRFVRAAVCFFALLLQPVTSKFTQFGHAPMFQARSTLVSHHNVMTSDTRTHIRPREQAQMHIPASARRVGASGTRKCYHCAVCRTLAVLCAQELPPTESICSRCGRRGHYAASCSRAPDPKEFHVRAHRPGVNGTATAVSSHAVPVQLQPLGRSSYRSSVVHEEDLRPSARCSAHSSTGFRRVRRYTMAPAPSAPTACVVLCDTTLHGDSSSSRHDTATGVRQLPSSHSNQPTPDLPTHLSHRTAPFPVQLFSPSQVKRARRQQQQSKCSTLSCTPEAPMEQYRHMAP